MEKVMAILNLFMLAAGWLGWGLVVKGITRKEENEEENIRGR